MLIHAHKDGACTRICTALLTVVKNGKNLNLALPTEQLKYLHYTIKLIVAINSLDLHVLTWKDLPDILSLEKQVAE